MSVRMIRSVLAGLAIATMAFVGTTHAQTQVGDAYILFNYRTGEFRMNPGNAVATGGSYTNPSQTPLSFGVNSFGVEMDPAIGRLSTNFDDYFFPSGTWPLFFPQTGANPPGDAFGSAFQTYSLPNVDTSNGKAGPWITKGRPLAFDDRELPGFDRFSAALAPSASLKPS